MNTWSLSWHGLATMVGLEVRQRLRSRRWIWALAIWFVFIGVITALVMWTAYKSYSYECNPIYRSCTLSDSNAGPTAFAVIVLFVLGMGLVIAPAFTATSINGDRAQGTLATLQATKLSALEIAGGKLISAWLSAAVFLLVALPFITVSMILGSISVLQVLVCFAVIFLLVAIVCAIGLGWSSVLVRSAGSTVMTYLSVMVLTLISPLVLVMSLTFVQQEEEVQVWGLTYLEWDQYANQPGGRGPNDPPPVDRCHWYTRTQVVTRTDEVWWILVPNPFVIVADAAPLSPQSRGDLSYSRDPLSAIRATMREMARPVPRPLELDECWQVYNWSDYYQVTNNPDGTISVTHNGTPVEVPPSPVQPRPTSYNHPVWPYGLAINFIIGAVFFVISVQRLRIPYHKLAKDTRVA